MPDDSPDVWIRQPAGISSGLGSVHGRGTRFAQPSNPNADTIQGTVQAASPVAMLQWEIGPIETPVVVSQDQVAVPTGEPLEVERAMREAWISAFAEPVPLRDMTVLIEPKPIVALPGIERIDPGQVRLNLSLLQPDRFYEATFEGEKTAIRRLPDGTVEFYVIESSD